MWMAKYESRNFEFDAFGNTEAEAKAYLLDGLLIHAQQYNLEPDWFYPSDIWAREIHAKSVYRDCSELRASK